MTVREGKGGKARFAFFSAKTLRVVLRYLRLRGNATTDSPLVSSDEVTRLTYWGFRQIVRRRAARASLPEPNLHSFRRAFALMSLRNGIDIYSLQKLMGHADLTVLRRHLAQTEEDLRAAHQKSSTVDHLL